MTSPSEPASLAEVEKRAIEKLKKDKKRAAVWDYLDLATGDRQTYDDSFSAFKRFRFQPRVLTAGPRCSLHTTVLGQPIRMPVGIAPTVGYSELDQRGSSLVGRAAARAGTVMILSSLGDTSVEEFAASVPMDGAYWAQTYLFRDKRNTLDIVKNAERCGFGALVVTVDSPVEVARERWEATKEYIQSDVKTPAPNLKYLAGKERAPHLSKSDCWRLATPEVFCHADWEDLNWLKSQTKLPIILKGILTADSARRAAEFGVSGIIVSVHGGRLLDGSPAPLDAFPDVVNAVRGTNVEVYMDGGVRTGNDVVKALALGARAVFIGRPALHGFAVNGEEGVFKVLQILKEELTIAMALCGCSSLTEIDRSIVKHETEFHSAL